MVVTPPLGSGIDEEVVGLSSRESKRSLELGEWGLSLDDGCGWDGEVGGEMDEWLRFFTVVIVRCSCVLSSSVSSQPSFSSFNPHRDSA